MQSKVVLKEIPAGKFHSAIFTSYSFNIYFFEQQVLPMLGSKGIHYISLLVDGNMLDCELDRYSLYSEKRKRNYSIHGVQNNGAFHSKLIFLAGVSSLCVLIGSGNLTSSGHGKNLESWNAVYVESETDDKMGFVLQCWSYLKMLHSGIGKNGSRTIKTVEENCSLLNNLNLTVVKDHYRVNGNADIFFLTPFLESSLFKQLIAVLKNDTIHTITVMSPYYDAGGVFLHQLNKYLKPDRINIMLQSEFGAPPVDMNPSANMHFFEWVDNREGEIKQRFFHAKNIIFEGREYNYLISGSANASFAAFGNEFIQGVNQEACIVYKEKKADYLSLLGIKIKNKTVQLKDIEKINQDVNHTSLSKRLVFIREIEKNYETYTVCCAAASEIKNSKICLYNPKGQCECEIFIEIDAGETEINFQTPSGLHIISGCFFLNNEQVSNRQFVIDANAFEAVNPSPANRSLNQVRKLIEGGVFSTSKIIQYLSTIYRQKGNKNSVAGSISEKKKEDQKLTEGENVNLYLSYEEIQQEIQKLEKKEKDRVYIEYKSVRLWDSIVSYLRENRIKEEEDAIDEEETEDINKSSGRTDKAKKKDRNPISYSDHERLQQKTEKFLCDYWGILESKINNKKISRPNIIDLSMYLILVEMLLHLLGYQEKIKSDPGEDIQVHLLRLPFSETEYSWSEYVIKITGLFTLWCNQKSGFDYGEVDETKEKTILYKQMAYKSSLTVLSLVPFANQNEFTKKMKLWLGIALLNVDGAFNEHEANNFDIDDFKEFVPAETKEYVGEQLIEEGVSAAIKNIELALSNPRLTGINSIYHHPLDGYGYIYSTIDYAKDTRVKFLKLINTGYEWDENLKNYWNGKVYYREESKWILARKDETE